jgi:hypothetical protein
MESGEVERTALLALKHQIDLREVIHIGEATLVRQTLDSDDSRQEYRLSAVTHEEAAVRFRATPMGETNGVKGFSGHIRWKDKALVLTTTTEDAQAVHEDVVICERFDTRRVAVFIVHGTYDATSDWVKEIAGSVTFASEIRRGIGEQITHVEPFLWRSSIHHDQRMRAADDLAQLLDEERFQNDRIVLIGHSHGGNVCLAAAGKCRRKIDAVVCLATPCLCLLTRDDESQPLSLPIYCSPQARENIRTIMTLTAFEDSVVTNLADLRKGIDEHAAVAETRGWQLAFNYPRLLDDGGVIQEIVEDILSVKLSSNLKCSPDLGIADHNVFVACEADGLWAHSVVHSCRVGQLLGTIIRDDFSVESMWYLRTLVLPKDADSGGPLPSDAYQKWRSGHIHSGWTLTSLRVASLSAKRPNGRNWDLDGSRPDLRARFVHDGNRVRATNVVTDAAERLWHPWHHFPTGGNASLQVWDVDPTREEFIGEIIIDGAADRSPPETIETGSFTAELIWTQSHY